MQSVTCACTYVRRPVVRSRSAVKGAKEAAVKAEENEKAAEKKAENAAADAKNAEKMTVSPGAGTAAPIVDKWGQEAKEKAAALKAEADKKAAAENAAAGTMPPNPNRRLLADDKRCRSFFEKRYRDVSVDVSAKV